ncbi:hypothetical protein LguiA_035373 [Lonicera macranthoides]
MMMKMPRLVKKVEERGFHLLAGVRLSCCGGRWMSSNTVMSFGDGSQGALGLSTLLMGSDSYEPIPVPGLPSDVSSVAAGHYHSLAVTSQGQLWAWGRNNESQLARPLLSPRETWHEPKRVEGLNQVSVKSAFASGVISTALGVDGSLWVWGKSKRGQLGLGKGITDAVLPSRVEALAEEEIVKVSLGWGHALALTKDGKLFGWGYSADGRLGKIGETSETSPLESNARTAKMPKQSSRSIFEDAEKLVLEAMEKEKDMPIIWEPFLIEELRGMEVVDVACGLDHSLVLSRDGTLLSSGSNIYGQLGRAREDLGFLPVDITVNPISIASGLGHSMAICQIPSVEGNEDGPQILSWGWNQSSQLGRAGPENIPMAVEGLEEETPVSVSGGRVHSIALTSKGEVWAWGCGRNGRLGLGSSIDEEEPRLVELEGTEVLQAVSGFDHNLVLTSE